VCGWGVCVIASGEHVLSRRHRVRVRSAVGLYRGCHPAGEAPPRCV
jgi:hypothetical protein